MRFLFVGLGSIGARHLRNLVLELTARGLAFEIDAVRSSAGAARPLDSDIESKLTNSYSNVGELKATYDAVFVTNPSALHYDTLRQIVPYAGAVFIEKPVFTDPGADIAALQLRPGALYYVACPLRRSPVLQRVKELLKTSRPTAVRALCSSYLPEWRSSDFRHSYSANKALGGGVRLDLIHEWDYLLWLFGSPLTVTSVFGRFSSLEIDSDDTAVYVARYSAHVLTLQVDYTGRAARRELELYCEEETYIADIAHNELKALARGETERFSPVDIHKAELCEFLSMMSGACENVNDIANAMATLKIALS